MSTDDPTAATAQTRRRAAMPVDPSEDELARNWNLTPADLAVIAACRGADHRRRFALQLCMLRAHGRFLDDYRQAPVKIIGVVQNSPFLGYTGEREPPLLRPGFGSEVDRFGRAVGLPRSSALRLKRSEAQQRQPMR